MTTRVRAARADDAAALAELTTELGYPTDAAPLLRRLEAVFARDDDVVLVAVDSAEQPIGWIHVGVTHVLERDSRAVIHGLVVAATRRSGDIGAKLLAAAEDWARQRGIPVMLVRSRSTRQRAHRFYLERGYTEVKRSHVFEKPLV
jgi:GNAT superfamily N-acetyltransferase